ncbi:MAG: DUF3343 domain-containing protein [Actinobacteria bacterium]|nr:DUF3343 domain-containing protein [Actinomycetota bacterium]MBU4392432.1 DUF3343 domain-containing protein [Actinomycetota bacterium]MBU4402999.1 DUF3343 domain-containing protein [Actinomycetota bacterium]MBU4442679.1 DUF3343 domain-containing protein [Actinomycetota bacterium]
MDFDGSRNKMEGKSGLLVFDSTNQALKTERLLKSAGVACTVIPTPVEITAECGIALLFDGKWLVTVTEALATLESDGRRLLFPFKRNQPGGGSARKEGFA